MRGGAAVGGRRPGRRGGRRRVLTGIARRGAGLEPAHLVGVIDDVVVHVAGAGLDRFLHDRQELGVLRRDLEPREGHDLAAAQAGGQQGPGVVGEDRLDVGRAGRRRRQGDQIGEPAADEHPVGDAELRALGDLDAHAVADRDHSHRRAIASRALGREGVELVADHHLARQDAVALADFVVAVDHDALARLLPEIGHDAIGLDVGPAAEAPAQQDRCRRCPQNRAGAPEPGMARAMPHGADATPEMRPKLWRAETGALSPSSLPSRSGRPGARAASSRYTRSA